MADIFLKIVNMSISANWIVLAVLLLRLLLKKAPKWITVLLWGIVAIRLICPFSIESVMSLIPSAETITKAPDAPRPHFESGVTIIDNQVNDYLGGHYYEGVTRPTGHFVDITTILAIVWIVGIVVLLAYTIISYLRVKNKIGTAVLLRENIYQSENVVSHFVLGIIKPKIYLPFNMNEQDMNHVIAHENAHIRRKDHWWKPFGFLVLTLHWFNPLMWLGYVLLCRDIELACDEKVVKEFNNEQKADYSQALLTCSVNRRIIAACPLAFGEVGVKDRVKSVLNYKKPAFWVIIVAIITSIAVAVCFLTNPKTKTWQSDNYTITCNVISAECDNVVYEYMYGTLNVDYPYICVNWTNNTNDTLCFGDEFIIYKNDKELKPNNEIGFDAILHVVKPGKSKSENYVLSSYDLEKGATYRLEKSFYLESNPEQKYTAFISFSVDTRFSFMGRQYAGEKIVYENGSFSSIIYTNDNIPQFKISEQLEFLYKTEEVLNYEWKKIDGIQKIKLEKSNFDDLFTSEIWHDGITAKKIRKNNLNAFSSFDLNGTMYYLLEQKNGDIYIAQSNGNTSDFRWLFKMKEISKTSSAELENNNASVNLSQLKEKYPQFFNVLTDGGLTVYIWQMSANNYSCYLANTSMEAISDNSFAYDVGVSIAEMRTILTTYDIDQKDITIQPVINPLSSYYYEIDDAYRAKVKEMFWKDSYNVIDYDGSSIPKLNVSCGNASTEASMGTTEWTSDAGNGTMQTINGDSSHPLERMDYLLPLALKVNRSNNATPIVGLNFNVAPDSIKVNSWFLTENGKTKSFDAEVDGFNIKLNAGKETCIYEVVATWNKSEKYYGTVRYSFCVVENTEPHSFPSNKVYDVSLSFANWTDDSKIYTSSLNLSKMQSNSIQHLPIYKFDSLKDLKQFKESFGDILTMDSGWDEVPSFNEATAKYDTKFFEENSLMLVYVSASNCTHRFGLGSIGWDEKSFCINVVETTGKEFVDTAMAGWFLTVAVEKETIASCTEFDADLNNEIKLY